MTDARLPEAADLYRVFAAVDAARRDRGLTEAGRSTELGGQQLDGWPLRWLTIDDPPVTYLPDAVHTRSVSGAVMGALAIAALLAAILAIVSLASSDAIFGAIFGVVAVGCCIGVWQIDTATSRSGSRGPVTEGLYLLPDAMVLVERRETTAVAREDVVGFGVRQHAPSTRAGVQFREFVDVADDGATRRIDLQHHVDDHQRKACESWRAGTWPVPLPG